MSIIFTYILSLTGKLFICLQEVHIMGEVFIYFRSHNTWQCELLHLVLKSPLKENTIIFTKLVAVL